MENPSEYPTGPWQHPAAPLSDAADFIGAMPALKRAAAKAIERARRAGLEPVLRHPIEQPMESMLREDPTPYGTPSHSE